jgi:hypothetical protein
MVASHGGQNTAPFPLAAVDREQFALSDDEFKPHSWDELKQIIGVASSFRMRNLHVQKI